MGYDHLELGDDVRHIEMRAGSFQLACFDHEAELLELGEITQGGAISDSGHFLMDLYGPVSSPAASAASTNSSGSASVLRLR